MAECNISGRSPLPSTWTYEVTLYGPDGSTTIQRPAASMCHIRLGYDAARPHRGVSPLARCGLSSGALSAIETRLREEATAASAYALSSPEDGQGAASAKLRQDLKAAKGRHVLVESFAGGWGDKGAAPQKDWQQSRLGFAPVPELQPLRSALGMEVAAALGIPAALIEPGADGTAQREGYRRLTHGTLAGMGRIAASTLGAALEQPSLKFSFEELYGSDLVGRVSSFKRLVESGVPLAEAAGVAGLLISDD